MIDVNLKFLRKTHNFSQEEVAEKIKVSRQAVAKWENGETLPDINNCVALASLYNVSLDILVNHVDEFDGVLLPPKGKHIFGVVKVGERGQVVLPKMAREIFHIQPGDSLLVLGDEAEHGIAMMKNCDLKEFAQAILNASK